MADAETTAAFNFASTPPNESSADAQTFDLQYFIWVFVLPFVLLVGIIGNILSIVVLQSKSFRHTTTGVYLPLTAAADIIFLLTGALEILQTADIFNAREYNIWTCRLYKVLHYTSGDVSIWLLVAFTFDRFVAVCFPLSKRRVCTWKRAAIASGAILFLAMAKNFHEFWTRGPEFRDNGELRRICGSQPQYAFFLNYIRPWLVFAVVMVIPFVLIFLFNCSIVRGLLKAKRDRSLSIASVYTTSSGTGNKPSKSNTTFRQTTLMCLSISFAFLILIAPSIVLLIGKPYWKFRTNVAYQHSKAISNFLVFVNHFINFFLYCVTGQRFRDELKAMLTCQPRGGTQVTISTSEAQSPRISQGQLDIRLVTPRSSHEQIDVRFERSPRTSHGEIKVAKSAARTH